MNQVFLILSALAFLLGAFVAFTAANISVLGFVLVGVALYVLSSANLPKP